MNKTAIMKVWSSSEYGGDADFAIVELDPEYAQLLLRRMDVASAQRAQDTALYALTFWSGQPSFVCRGALPEDLAERVENEELVILDEELPIAESDVQRVECVQAVVTGEDIYWEALIKHTSIRLETATCSRAVLEEIAPLPAGPM